MKIKPFVAVALALACSTALADATYHVPLLELVKNKIDGFKKLRVGEYRQVWGTQNSSIDEFIAAAARNASAEDPPTTLSEAINAGKGQTRGFGQSCVIYMVVANNGAYTSSRDCTTEYATRSYMDTVIYPSIGVYLVGRLPNIDFAQDNGGTGYAAFYTPAGHVSEFIVFSNATQ